MERSVVKVMIVEDAQDYQDLLVLTLSLEPYVKVAYTASSGEEALDAFDRISPELVLLDFKLPGIDGLETARRMKKKQPDVKIALVTAYPEEALARSAEEVNVEEVIPKSHFSLARVQKLLGWDS